MNEETIRIPDIGEFSKVPVIELNIKVGDNLQKEQALITLETEKATMEIPSPSVGKVTKLLLKVGDTVSRGDPICTVEALEAPKEGLKQAPKAEKKPEQQAEKKPKAPLVEKVPEKESSVTSKREEIYAGPATRRLAYQLGVRLSHLTGTGRHHRIVTEDVHQYVKKHLAQPVGHFAVAAMPEIDFKKFGSIDEKPLSRIKKLSASFLHRNWVSIPHVTQFDMADVTELEQFRKAQQTKMTILVFVMKALIQSLKAYPQFNASLSKNGETLIYKHYYHLGVAVDTPGGLVVPVIRDVDKKGMVQLATELAEISSRAREGALKATDMQGSSFSISSLGGVGGTAFTPIINAPDVAILGLSKMSWQPVYQQEKFVPRFILPLSLSYDHRVIDGAEAARFTSHVVAHLNDIRKLLL